MKSAANLEKYFLHRKRQIVQALRLLAKNKCLITGRFDAGKYSFMTMVIDVRSDKNAVVLDYGSDEAINKKLLDAEKVTFSGSYQGIQTRFLSGRVIRTEYKGETVFAVSIPESLQWRERREFYRVKLPLSDSIHCEIPKEEGDVVKLTVLSLSIKGFALFDPGDKSVLPPDIGTRIPGCRLVFPDNHELSDLEIRHQTPVMKEGKVEGQRIGCAFVGVSQGYQSKILQYMRLLERKSKHMDR